MFNILDQLFGGKEQAKAHLASALRQGRERAKLSQSQFDKFCGFGEHAPKVESANLPRGARIQSPLQLPASSEYESDPNLLTGAIFSIGSQVLGVELDKVLRFEPTDKQRGMLKDQMRKSQFRFCPLGGSENPQEDDQISVYALLCALDEIDA